MTASVRLSPFSSCCGAFAALLLAAAAVAQSAGESKRDATLRERAQASVRGVVQGQCVDDETGAPLAGCTVCVRCGGGVVRDRDEQPQELLVPRDVVTGADGRFAVPVLAKEGWYVVVMIHHPERQERDVRRRSLLPGTVEDLGTLRMVRGVVARARIVDTDGHPVPGVVVGAMGRRVGLGVDTEWSRNLEPAGGGAVASEDPWPAGTYTLRIFDDAIHLVEPATLTVPERETMEPVTIRVRLEPFLGGIVVDEHGVPVAGVTLRTTTDVRSCGGTTDQDGVFRIYNRHHLPPEVGLTIEKVGPCERAALPPKYTWGTTDIRVELKRAPCRDIEVVVAGTREAVVDFAVRGFPIRRNEGHSFDTWIRLGGAHAGGKLRVDALPRGSCRLTVIPADEHLLPVSAEFDSADGAPPLRIEVPRLVPMVLQVLDSQGQPAPAGVDVCVIELGNFRGPSPECPVDPRAEQPSQWSSDPTVTFDTILYTTRTDAGGQAIVFGIEGRDDLQLAVRSGGKIVQRESNVAFGQQHQWRELKLRPR